MKSFRIAVIITIVLLSFISCKGTKNMTGASCRTEGVVIDMTGMDGCGLLIALPSGKKLLPVSLPDDAAPLRAGQEVFFDYKMLPDRMSVCMAESAIVALTCLRVKDASNCVNTGTPMAIDWMKEAAGTHHSEQIIRFKSSNNQWAYLFSGKEKYLYDCKGKLLSKGDDFAGYVRDVKGGVIIWVREYRND